MIEACVICVSGISWKCHDAYLWVLISSLLFCFDREDARITGRSPGGAGRSPAGGGGLGGLESERRQPPRTLPQRYENVGTECAKTFSSIHLNRHSSPSSKQSVVFSSLLSSKS